MYVCHASSFTYIPTFACATTTQHINDGIVAAKVVTQHAILHSVQCCQTLAEAVASRRSLLRSHERCCRLNVWKQVWGQQLAADGCVHAHWLKLAYCRLAEPWRCTPSSNPAGYAGLKQHSFQPYKRCTGAPTCIQGDGSDIWNTSRHRLFLDYM